MSSLDLLCLKIYIIYVTRGATGQKDLHKNILRHLFIIQCNLNSNFWTESLHGYLYEGTGLTVRYEIQYSRGVCDKDNLKSSVKFKVLWTVHKI